MHNTNQIGKNRSATIRMTACLLTLLAAAINVTHATEGSTTLSWQNQLVNEGIADDASSGFLLAEIGMQHHGFIAGLEFIQGIRHNYNELNLSAGYELEMGPASIGGELTRTEFPSGNDPGTWQVSAGLEIAMGEWVALVFDGLYDIDEVRAGFLETGLQLTPPPCGPGARLSLEPYVLVGWDFGFVSGPRRLNENHIQFGVAAEWALTESASLLANINHSEPLANLDHEGIRNTTWGGIGISFTY